MVDRHPGALGPPREYHVHARFRAPLPFVFRWCTDYQADDPTLEHGAFVRRILHRDRRRVVYEDLYDKPTGWFWSHQTITLRPPDRWHAEAVGNARTWSLDYRLTQQPDGTTTLVMRGDRQSTKLGGKNPPKTTLERELSLMWAKFVRALERDYRRTRAR